MSRPRQPPQHQRNRDPVLRVTVHLRMPRQIGWIALGVGLGNVNGLPEILRMISHLIHTLPR
jgi:hypothetical protein